MSWKITFNASKDIGSRTLVLLLAFDLPSSNVTATSNQENYPVAWKILKFQSSSTLVHEVTYTDRRAFTKSEPLTPSKQNPERVILSPNPKIVQPITGNQETMLVQDPDNPTIYSFVKPIPLSYPSSVAMNGTSVVVPPATNNALDLAFGFYEIDNLPAPAQIISFHQIPQYMPVALEFVPILKAYFVPENFYAVGEVLTMPIPTDPALKVDIHSLSKNQLFSIFIDKTNRAGISYDDANKPSSVVH